MSEYIGSLIAVISNKSLIKFVGTLHQIDSSSLTVTLENVKAFGTEGRAQDPSKEIPPSDRVFEQIVFPGQDVLDLKIISQAPKDAQQPQGQQGSENAAQYQQPQYQQQPPYQQGFDQGPPQHGFNQQWHGPPPPQNYPSYGQYPPQNSQFAPPGGAHGFPGAPGAVPTFGPPPGWQQHGFPQGPPPGGPGAFPQQSPQAQAPGQSQENHHPGQKGAAPQQQPSQGPPLPTGSKPTDLTGTSILTSTADALAPPLPSQSKPEQGSIPTEPKSAKPQGASANPRVAVPSIAPRPSGAPTGPKPAAQPQSSAPKNATEAAAAAVAAAMAKLGSAPGKPAGKPSTEVDTLAHRISEMSTSERGRGRGRGHHHEAPGRGGRGPRRGGAPRQPVEVPTTDFDFESANAKFNKQDLVKQSIATGSPAGTPSEEPTAAEGGLNGADAADDDVVIPGAGAAKYNKTSSFFDDLSSELKDRQVVHDEGRRMGGPDFRSEERKRNMETFGEASPFRGRGGMRGGRGCGYSRGGRGGGYRRGGGVEQTF